MDASLGRPRSLTEPQENLTFNVKRGPALLAVLSDEQFIDLRHSGVCAPERGRQPVGIASALSSLSGDLLLGVPILVQLSNR